MSNELAIIQNTNLPDTIGDLSKFILVGREKLTAVRAEIRAIDKLKLAEDVHAQKLEEAAMLAEALLDAEVRLGELIKKIPKAKNQHKPAADSGVGSKPKKEVVADLGLSEKQAERLEILADNKDLVEIVKAEARENDDIPTRSRVLNLAAQKNKKSDDYGGYLNLHIKVCKEFSKIIDRAKSAMTDNRPQFLQMIKDSAKGEFDVVLIHKLDRFARNRYDSAHYRHQLKRNNVKLISVIENIDDSPEGIIMTAVLEGMAEYYSQNLAREMRKGMTENALKGRHILRSAAQRGQEQ